MLELWEDGYRYFLRCRSARAIPCIHRIRLLETAKPVKMIEQLSKVVCEHFLNWFVGETFKILILYFAKKHISSMFWVRRNLVYRRYMRCIGECTTAIKAGQCRRWVPSISSFKGAMGEISNFYNLSPRLFMFGTHIPHMISIHAAKVDFSNILFKLWLFIFGNKDLNSKTYLLAQTLSILSRIFPQYLRYI